ncbi:MAG: ABC transporter permease subunit [Candidatus Saccharimonadales bacterium]
MNSPISTIVKVELRQRKAYLLWWSVGIIALIALTVLAYGSLKGQADQLNKALSSLSSNISGFVGTSDMFSPVGYLNSQLYFITLPILFIILSVTTASKLIGKEETGHTMELLLSRPISRSQLLIAKALSSTAIVAILGAVAATATIAFGIAINIGVSTAYIILTTLIMVLFSGAFGALAFMLYAAGSRTRGAAAAVAILFSLGGYILSSLSGMVHGLAWVAKLFPYHYYNPGKILTGHVSRGLIIYIAVLYIGSTIIALIAFRRRDIE